MREPKTACLLGAVAAILLWGTSVVAQTNEGRILGTVTDQQGKVIVSAKVVITNNGTGSSRTVTTNQAGDYVAPDLIPGAYTVSAEAQGFKKVVHASVQLEVAKDVRLDFQLVPGEVTEVVRVTAEATLIDTTNDNIGGTFANKAINDLPLNGRDYQNLAVLRPGVTRTPGGGFESITSNGMRPEDNNFILEGTDDNDPYYAGNIINAEGVQGTPGSILPIDAIQEFNTEENPSVEYGWKPGATINIGLKSGTNELHGSAYYFGRNNALDARNDFNTKPDPQRALHQHQFGGSIGGPVIHNKTFFFGAYEGVRGFVSNANTVFTPASVSLAASNPTTPNCTFIAAGDCNISLVDAIDDLRAGKIPLNPTSLNIVGLGSFTGNGPFPGLFPINSGGSGTIISGFPNVNRSDTVVVKLDHHLSETHSLSVRYLIGDSAQIEQDATVLRPQWRSLSNLRAQVFGANWTWTPQGNWVNEARFGFNRFWQTILPADHSKNPLTTYGVNTGVTQPINFGMPEIDFGSFDSLGNVSGWPLETIPNQTFQFADNVSYVHGKHTLRFGGEFRHGSTDNIRNRHSQGRIKFENGGNTFSTSTSLEDFLAGNPDTGTIFVGDSERHVHLWSFGGFVQDDWRVTPRLTLNLGLRYELNTVINESHNLLGNFDPAVGLEQVGVNVSSPYDGDHNNFAPRIGLAWDPFGRGKTVFRAGAGVNYEIPHISVFIGQNGVDNATTPGLNDIPTGAIGSNVKGNILATGITLAPCSPGVTTGCLNYAGSGPNSSIFGVAGTTLNCDPTAGGTPCDILGVTRHLRTPYVISWNFNVQQQLTPTTSIQVGYVGNHGIKLYSVRDINQVVVANDNGTEQFGRPFNFSCPPPVGAGAGGPCFPFLGFVNFLENLYFSNFHSLQVTGTQKLWHGLTFLAGYTWSHSIDDASFNRDFQPQDSTRPFLERGNSDFDVRHRFTLAMSYDLPSVKTWAHLLEGWQINSIVTAESGTPWTVVDGVLVGNDVSLTGEFVDRWNLNGDPSKVHFSTSGPIPCDFTDPVLGICTSYAKGIITFPGFGHFGNMGRNLFRGPRLDNWDFSLVKTTSLTERLKMQLRAEFFNVLNHPHFANPEATTLFQVDPSDPTSFGFSSATPDVAAANPVIGTGGPRNIQLGLKFIF